MRLLHLYFGVLIAPSLLFFAVTGALQTFNLHETTRGSSYVPPRWAVVLGQIHKKQTPIVPVRRPPAAERPTETPAQGAAPLSKPAPSPELPSAAAGRVHHPLPLKIFFFLVSIGLCVSVLTGIFLSYRYGRSPRMVTALLIFGVVLPLVLVMV